MRVINLWGSPGAGKSTVAAGLFWKMKVADYDVELINEYAKDVAWEGRKDLLRDQLYLMAQQNRKLERLRGKVDYVISDSPLLLTLAYAPDLYYSSFAPLVKEIWDSYDNDNHLIIRTHPYKQAGRVHSEEQSNVVDRKIRQIFEEFGITTNVIYANTEWAVEQIFNNLEQEKTYE